MKVFSFKKEVYILRYYYYHKIIIIDLKVKEKIR